MEEYGLQACVSIPGQYLINFRKAILKQAKDKERVIDRDGCRPNVGIVICNDEDQVFWGRRINGRDSWQFPQGGMNRDESPEVAMYRELEEEVGLCPESVDLLGRTQGWLHYRLPKRFIRKIEDPVCIGQKQIWFLLRLTGAESEINLAAHDHPEFDHWKWVSYWYPVTAVVDFKQAVYRQALTQLACRLAPKSRSQRRHRRQR